MTKKELICINCPIGCMLEVEMDETGIHSIRGNQCKRGELYAQKELTNPRRTVTSIVPVLDGVEPMVSVKTASDIPKDNILDVMKALKTLVVTAPVSVGQVVLENVADTNVCVIATKSVDKR